MATSLAPFSSSVLIPAFAGFIPALFWLWFWLREDRKNPEPKLTILAVFLAGAASTMIALPLQKYTPELIGGNLAQPDFVILLLWAGAEELSKYIAAAYVALSTRYFDEPIDAMIYMLTAALGFAALENSLYIFNGFNGGGITEVIQIGNSRFLGATLLHVVSSVVAGGALAFAFKKRPSVRVLYTTLGLITASVLHALYNFFIINSDGNFPVLLVLWVSVILVFLLFEKVKHLIT